MEKKYQIFSLQEAISDVTRLEVVYDDYGFILRHYDLHDGSNQNFQTEDEAAKCVEGILKDYNRRGIEDARFVILPVYFTKKDKLFQQP